MDAKSLGYRSGDVSLNDYVRFLRAEAGKNGISLIRYANLSRLVKVLAARRG